MAMVIARRLILGHKEVNKIIELDLIPIHVIAERLSSCRTGSHASVQMRGIVSSRMSVFGSPREQFAEEAAASTTSKSSQQAYTEQSNDHDAKAGTHHQHTANSEQAGEASKAKDNSGTGRQWKDRLQLVAASVWRDVVEVVSPQEEVTSALRAPAAADVASPQQYQGSTAVVVGKPPETAWQRQFRHIQDILSNHPFFQRFASIRRHTVFQKGQEVADNIRERWETSDNPLIHRIQDMSDSMFSENEPARALREIRSRDPAFDLVKFLMRIKGDVVPVIQAYLTGNEQTLRQYCSPEMVERLMGIVKAMHAQDLYSDSTVLDISEVELVDLKFLEDQPIVVVQFNCQQINCSRDKFGNVVDGAPDSVHRVYYYWALQQDEQGYTSVDGTAYPPRWVLKEMLVRGMHNLL